MLRAESRPCADVAQIQEYAGEEERREAKTEIGQVFPQVEWRAHLLLGHGSNYAP